MRKKSKEATIEEKFTKIKRERLNEERDTIDVISESWSSEHGNKSCGDKDDISFGTTSILSVDESYEGLSSGLQMLPVSTVRTLQRENMEGAVRHAIDEKNDNYQQHNDTEAKIEEIRKELTYAMIHH